MWVGKTEHSHHRGVNRHARSLFVTLIDDNGRTADVRNNSQQTIPTCPKPRQWRGSGAITG